jgi:hypothetical protein
MLLNGVAGKVGNELVTFTLRYCPAICLEGLGDHKSIRTAEILTRIVSKRKSERNILLLG